ncbi:MAG: hypothetical protein SXQ77_11715 [Halobacteria archaeon]|nr:hypothetical protein [Halobacteria archaeon]
MSVMELQQGQQSQQQQGMKLQEIRAVLDSNFETPVDRTTVVDDLGDTEIMAPNGCSETVAEVLERDEETEYTTINELYDSICGNVCDDFVGRKYYDDRSPNLGFDTGRVESF